MQHGFYYYSVQSRISVYSDPKLQLKITLSKHELLNSLGKDEGG